MREVTQRFAKLFLPLCLSWISNPLFPSSFTLHVGAISVGTGGPNPVSLPPTSLQEYEFVWINDSKIEYSAGVIPGLLVGQRFVFEPAYVSLGGGIVVDANGVGPGVYSASGLDICGSTYCFNVEFKRALGISRESLISPYALRMGMTVKL